MINEYAMPSPDSINKRILLPLLASIVAITPLAIDLYLPAMLVIANDLQTTMPNVQISLSIYLAGYALGMLFFGETPFNEIFPGIILIILAGLLIFWFEKQNG